MESFLPHRITSMENKGYCENTMLDGLLLHKGRVVSPQGSLGEKPPPAL